MLGLPEALQRHSPRVLAAVHAPRAQAPEYEGARGRRLGSLGSTGETEASADFHGAWALSSSPQGKQLQQGVLWGHVCGNMCMHGYGVIWT